MIIFSSCNNQDDSSSSTSDTTSANSSLQQNVDASPLLGDTIPRLLAIDMIKKFQGNAYKLQMVRLDGSKIRQLTNAQDSIRLWMAVDTSNKITMILQQKRTNPSISYTYYNLRTILGSDITTAEAEKFLCPEPPNCDVQIEL